MEKFPADVVSIPSRGSGKGDFQNVGFLAAFAALSFQSPLGEVVKETMRTNTEMINISGPFQSPLGEVVKETRKPRYTSQVLGQGGFNPLSGKW